MKTLTKPQFPDTIHGFRILGGIMAKPGEVVNLETIILENNELVKHVRDFLDSEIPKLFQLKSCTVPDGHREGFVPKSIYEAYQASMTKACYDVVICTMLENGKFAVLGLKRKLGTAYGGTWYMVGGALPGYRPFSDFISEKSLKECGIRVESFCRIGVYRNDAEDHPTSVIAVCDLVFVPLVLLEQRIAGDGHDESRLFTLEDLNELPDNERHWYPMHVWLKALVALEEARPNK